MAGAMLEPRVKQQAGEKGVIWQIFQHKGKDPFYQLANPLLSYNSCPSSYLLPAWSVPPSLGRWDLWVLLSPSITPVRVCLLHLPTGISDHVSVPAK